MEILFFVVLICKLLYDGITKIVASVIAEQQYEAYKRLRRNVEKAE